MKEQVIIITICQYETRRCDNACLEYTSIQTKPGLETLFIDNPFMLKILLHVMRTTHATLLRFPSSTAKKISLTTKHLLTQTKMLTFLKIESPMYHSCKIYCNNLHINYTIL